MMERFGGRTLVGIVLVASAAIELCSCAPPSQYDVDDAPRRADVRPGITVLIEDSTALVDGKRIGLLTNQTGIDRRGSSDIDLLAAPRTESRRWPRGGPRLVRLFSPEHGIRGTEDREHIASGRDERTNLPIVSLFESAAIAPPDSTLADLDALVIDLQDIGSRTWTYQGSMVYAMRGAAKRRLPVIVLDRPNPITGGHVEGPMLDATLASERKAFALYRIPLRHGLTMGELALLYNQVFAIGCDLHVVPASGWHRDEWFDDTGLRWVRPSPNIPSLESEILYPGLVAFEGTNLSVGRGTSLAFQRLGAPWLDARRVVALLEDRTITGVRFEAERFTPDHPTDGKFSGREINGVRIVIEHRDRVQSTRIGATLLWAIAKVNGDSLRVNVQVFDERFGSPRAREALLRGDDPDGVMDRELPATIAFDRTARAFWLYR